MKMLGRYQVPGCCPGTKAGRDPGPDCSGGGSMGARVAKRAEQQKVDAEVRERLSELYGPGEPIDEECDGTDRPLDSRRLTLLMCSPVLGIADLPHALAGQPDLAHDVDLPPAFIAGLPDRGDEARV